MNRSESKIIRTEIDSELHQALKRISHKEKKSLRKILKEALEDYVRKYRKDIENDTFFKLIGSIETKEGNWSERDDWRL